MLGGAFFQPETLFKKELLGLLVMVGKSEFGRKNGSYHSLIPLFVVWLECYMRMPQLMN
jgi:hypothetical protein